MEWCLIFKNKNGAYYMEAFILNLYKIAARKKGPIF